MLKIKLTPHKNHIARVSSRILGGVPQKGSDQKHILVAW